MKYVAFSILLALAVLVSAIWPSGSQAGPGGQGGRVVENAAVNSGPADANRNEITVRFVPGTTESLMRQTAAGVGAHVLETRERSGLVRLRAASQAQAVKLARALEMNPLVAEVGPSRDATIISRPNDPMYSYQWHMRSAAGGSWADTAWDMAANRGAGVTVAVIDTGVAYENYKGRLGRYRQTFVQAPDLADATFVAPRDFANNDGHANDDHGHGTHVAGTIAQSTNNGYGMAGVAPNATIMPVKAMDYAGNGTEAGVIEAIYYAVDNGADVINMSLGFPGTGIPDGNGNVCTEILGLNAALQYAYDQGVVIVAAAGNSSGSEPLCPAAYPTVVSVAATRYDGGISSYSNTGADISAPGGEPTLDQDGDGYVDGVLQETFCYSGVILLMLDWYGNFCSVLNSGTSMASPHVAGTAALLLGEDLSLSVDEVRNLLYSTARDNGAPGFDSTFGWGNLDSAAAVGSLLGVAVPQPTPMPGLQSPTNVVATAVSTSQIDIAWTDNATAEAGYKLERSLDGVNFSLIATLAANATGYSNISLAAGTTYHYRVKAYEGADYSPYGGPVSATTQPPPAAPSDLTATALSSSKIQLTWVDNATNEDGFRLERSTDGVTFSLVATLAADLTSYTNSNLVGDTTYSYRVRAYEGTNYSDYSNTASATTQPPPAAPSNLAATAVSTSQIDLTWTDNATNEAGFRLERSTDGVNFSQAATLAANTTSYSNVYLVADTTYTYRVRAYDGGNASEWSNTASATTQPAPAAPTSLTATALSSSKIQLIWVDNATNEDGFKLERATDGVNFSLVATLVANLTSYTNSNLAGDTTYSYRLRTFEGTNYSDYSNTASATTQPPPAAPSNLAAMAVSTSQIDLTWTDNATNEAGFRLERSTDGVNFSLAAMLAANTTSYANVNLAADTTYSYRLQAYEGTNYSHYSNTASATTQPPPDAPAAPSGLTATALSSSKIQLNWVDNATNEAGFKLERSTDGVNFSLVATLVADLTSYTNSNLAGDTSYTYRLRAYAGTSYSDYSNTASATTQAIPAAPSNLTATAVSTSRIDLTWTDNATNEAGFRLERSTDGVTFLLAASLTANTTSYSNVNLTAGTAYTYRIRAYDGANVSDWSNTASATTQPTPAAPTGLTATAIPGRKISLSWTDNSWNETGFKIERSTDGVNFLYFAATGANVSTYTSLNLTAGTTYYYRVRAYEGLNHSAYSNVASATATK